MVIAADQSGAAAKIAADVDQGAICEVDRISEDMHFPAGSIGIMGDGSALELGVALIGDEEDFAVSEFRAGRFGLAGKIYGKSIEIAVGLDLRGDGLDDAAVVDAFFRTGSFRDLRADEDPLFS